MLYVTFIILLLYIILEILIQLKMSTFLYFCYPIFSQRYKIQLQLKLHTLLICSYHYRGKQAINILITHVFTSIVTFVK